MGRWGNGRGKWGEKGSGEMRKEGRKMVGRGMWRQRKSGDEDLDKEDMD